MTENLKKQVREFAAGKAIGASLVFKKPGNIIVATVHSYYGNTGLVRCDVWAPHQIVHQGVAGGYGYDKFTASLVGAVIDGHTCTDHCGVQLDKPKEGYFPSNFKVPQGYHLANWVDADDGSHGYGNCYRYAGLDFFRNHEDYWVETVI